MKPFIEQELEKALKKLGCREVTSKTQSNNGTTAWELPVKMSWHRRNQEPLKIVVAEYRSGYVRNVNECFWSYQLNPREYKMQYSGKNGESSWLGASMILLPTRAERLAKLLSYTIHRINKENKC